MAKHIDRNLNSDTNNAGIFAVLSVLHILGWLAFGFIYLLYLMFSGAVLFTGFLGDNAGIILLSIVVSCALSPLYLFFIKRKWIKYLIMYSITSIFIIFFFGLAVISKNHFSIFTKEKWQEYPQFRYNMLDNLKEKHGLIGMDGDEIVELLGMPDVKNETAFAYYLRKVNKDREYIEIAFRDGIVISVTYHNLL